MTAGVEHDGTSVAINNNVATVTFATLQQSGQIAEAGMHAGAIGAADGAFNQSGAPYPTTAGEPNQDQTVLGPAGGTNANPLLISTAAVTVGGHPTDQVDFTFDKQVDPGTAADYRLYDVNDRTVITGTSAVAGQASRNTIRVSFNGYTPDVADFLNEFVRAGALTGAATGTNTGAANVLSTVPLNPSASAPGFTSGPDVTSADRESTGPDAPGVLLTFDSELGGYGTPADYSLIGPSGAVMGTATGLTPVNTGGNAPNELLVDFGNTGNISAAAGIQIAFPTTDQPAFEPPQVGDLFGFTVQDPAVIQSVAFASGTAGQRIARVKATSVVFKGKTHTFTKKHTVKKHTVKKHTVKKHTARKH
jgi:hypothetical protein